MSQITAAFQIKRAASGWYIVYQVYQDGGRLIMNAAQRDTAQAREWIRQYCKGNGLAVGQITEI